MKNAEIRRVQGMGDAVHGRRQSRRSRSAAASAIWVGVLLLVSTAPMLAWSESESAGESATESEAAEQAPGSLTFVGRNLIGRAKGSFRSWRFTRFDVDWERIEQGSVEVEIDIDSIETGIGRRDAHLRNPDFFETERWPVARVRVHGARPDGRSEAGHARYKASFDIQIRDVEKTIEGSFEIVRGEQTTIEGELSLDRVDFGVGKPHSGWNPMSVREEVPIRFSVPVPASR
jgi:polyisoprenoid-binding protein YceI